MICGISGSGKTAFSKEMELFGIKRLSVDEELWPDFYVLADVISDEHREFLYTSAMERIKARVANFCAEGRPCSIDMPFCKRLQRDFFRKFIEEHGGKPVLIWINTDLPVLKERLLAREGKNGPNNLPVSNEEIEMYWRGFERPTDEEHIEVDGTREFDTEKLINKIK